MQGGVQGGDGVTNDLSPTDKMRIDKLRREIRELLDEMMSQHLRTFSKFGFAIELWKRGIEISRPKTYGMKYTVYVIGWWPPMWKTRERGRYIGNSTGGMLDEKSQ